MVRGQRPELNDMVRNCGATANSNADEAEETGGRHRSEETGANQTGEQELLDLLQTVLQDGAISTDEIAQLRQALAFANPPGTGGGGGEGGGTSGGSRTSGGGPTGSCSGRGSTPGTGETPGVDGTPGIGPDGSLTLGNTKITIQGGTAEGRAETAGLIEQMYEKDPGFKQGVDSKARSGLEITIRDLAPGVAGQATLGGNEISLDTEGLNYSTREYADTIAHELAHNLGQRHGPALEAFASSAAAVVA